MSSRTSPGRQPPRWALHKAPSLCPNFDRQKLPQSTLYLSKLYKGGLPRVKPAKTALPMRPNCKLSILRSSLIVMEPAGKTPWSILFNMFSAINTTNNRRKVRSSNCFFLIGRAAGGITCSGCSCNSVSLKNWSSVNSFSAYLASVNDMKFCLFDLFKLYELWLEKVL